MSIINIGIIGANGKMGQAVQEVCSQEVCSKSQQDEIRKKYKISKQFTKTNALLDADQLKNVDVCIDFSNIEYAYNHAQICNQAGIPIFIGTTGDLQETLREKLLVFKNIPIMFAPTSCSITFLLIRKMLEQLKKWEISIGDIHLYTKKDTPAGTTKDIMSFMQNIQSTYSFRNNINGAKMIFNLSNQNEDIQLTYTTYNRLPFAHGAITISSWLISQKPGLYHLSDFYT